MTDLGRTLATPGVCGRPLKRATGIVGVPDLQRTIRPKKTGCKSIRALMALAGLLTAALMPSSAFAWSDVGHRVICQIAYEELKPEIKARVDALAVIDPKFRTFADGCTWPDVFPRVRSPEHYVDLPRSAKGIEVCSLSIGATSAKPPRSSRRRPIAGPSRLPIAKEPRSCLASPT